MNQGERQEERRGFVGGVAHKWRHNQPNNADTLRQPNGGGACVHDVRKIVLYLGPLNPFAPLSAFGFKFKRNPRKSPLLTPRPPPLWTLLLVGPQKGQHTLPDVVCGEFGAPTATTTALMTSHYSSLLRQR